MPDSFDWYSCTFDCISCLVFHEAFDASMGLMSNIRPVVSEGKIQMLEWKNQQSLNYYQLLCTPCKNDALICTMEYSFYWKVPQSFHLNKSKIAGIGIASKTTKHKINHVPTASKYAIKASWFSCQPRNSSSSGGNLSQPTSTVTSKQLVWR